MIIDQFEKESNKSDPAKFKYVIMPDKNKVVVSENEVFPCVHLFTSNDFYENTYCGKMMFNRLKKKIPVIGVDF